MAEGKSWVKWVAIGCSGLVVLGVVVGAGIFFVVRKATAGPEQVAKDFLAAAAAGARLARRPRPPVRARHQRAPARQPRAPRPLITA